MFNFTSDKSAIATSIFANIILSFSIELQKYAKKEIIELALHGLPSVSVQRMWKVAFSLLVVAECMYYVWYGLSGTTSMTPMGVYTMFANCVLPPLFSDSRSRTLGTTCTMMGILMLIHVPAQDAPTELIWDDSFKHALAAVLFLCLGLSALRSYRPASCSLKITANCGLSGLLGSIAVCLIKVLTNKKLSDGSVCGLDGDDFYGFCQYIPLGWALILVIFFLQTMLLSDILEYFPVWQVIAHHHVLFSSFLLAENVTIFHEYEQSKLHEVLAATLGHSLALMGVWVAARPHLDIPPSIATSTILPRLTILFNKNIKRHIQNQTFPVSASYIDTQQQALQTEDVDAAAAEYEIHHLEEEMMKEMNISCIRELYCLMIYEHLKANEGFKRRQSVNDPTPNMPYAHPVAEP